MNMQLIEGHFTSAEAIDIITQMVHIKIRFQEGKITPECSEENIKMRERRIQQLQIELGELVRFIHQKSDSIGVIASVEVE